MLMYTLGVDIGSTTSKCAVLKDGTELVAHSLQLGGLGTGGPEEAMAALWRDSGLRREDMACIFVTGYGRKNYEGADGEISELTAHALGGRFVFPDLRTVIDIGGQDAKVIALSPSGKMTNFVMNDKCAAGTGRFLEMMAHTLEMPLEELSRAGLSSTREVRISNMCSVFAESEVVSLIADDTPTADIVAGLCMSVANKTKSLARRVNAEPAYLMTGGVANNEGVVQALSKVLGAPVRTHEDSQLCGAIGAALLGLERLRG